MCAENFIFAISSQAGLFFIAPTHIDEQQQRSACMYICDVTVEPVMHSLRSTSKLHNLANSEDKARVDIVHSHVTFQARQCIQVDYP